VLLAQPAVKANVAVNISLTSVSRDFPVIS
jgi:hypothetical protein